MTEEKEKKWERKEKKVNWKWSSKLQFEEQTFSKTC